jgi:hypothetical protein
MWTIMSAQLLCNVKFTLVAPGEGQVGARHVGRILGAYRTGDHSAWAAFIREEIGPATRRAVETHKSTVL